MFETATNSRETKLIVQTSKKTTHDGQDYARLHSFDVLFPLKDRGAQTEFYYQHQGACEAYEPYLLDATFDTFA